MFSFFTQSFFSLGLTIILGFYFTVFQLLEYKWMSFSMSDSVFGGIFFLTTGFHGFHVVVGSIFLSTSLFKMGFSHFALSNLIFLEMCIWYWHFVDMIWLMLFVLFYWSVY